MRLSYYQNSKLVKIEYEKRYQLKTFSVLNSFTWCFDFNKYDLLKSFKSIRTPIFLTLAKFSISSCIEKKKNQIVCLLSKKYCYGQMYISWQPQFQFWLTIWELRPSRKRALNVHSQCHIFVIRNINSFNQGLRNRANLNMHTSLSLISLHFPNSIYKSKLIK